MSSEPPEEPQFRNELSILSPASPKPIHFPTPTNITVLEMQHDVGFNQTEAHMNDPASHNTGVRPNLWRDPDDPPEEEQYEQHAQQQPEPENGAMDHVTPYSTGAEADTTITADTNGNDGEDIVEQGTHGADAVPAEATTAAQNPTSNPEPEPVQLSTTSAESLNDHATSDLDSELANVNPFEPSSDPSVPAADPLPAFTAIDTAPLSEAHADPIAPAFNPNPVDVQALLDTLQTAPSTAAANAAPQADGMTVATADSPFASTPTPQQVASYLSSPVSASGLSALPSGLPPRPPPQEQPLIHPNYVHSQHIRDYHPHAAKPAFQPHARSGSQGNAADPNSRNYVPPVNSPGSAQAAGATPQQQPGLYTPGTPSLTNGQPTQTSYVASAPYVATPTNNVPGAYAAYGGAPGYGPMAGTPSESQTERGAREGEQRRPEDRPWDAEVQRKYDRFIEEERRYVSEGRWEQFPNGARLFVGNLSSEKVTKRDIFHVFHTYGELAQISIKQAYGFVQFLRTEDCMRALEAEQGTQIRDKRIHLEISKPQKNRPQPAQRRSRSPDGGRGRPGGNVDRYNPSARSSNNNRRDGYRPGHRSPSPRGYRDRYDDRYHTRSRSPGYGRGGGGRHRSPSPRQDADDDLPLPKRDRKDVPDVQVIVLDDLDRDFVKWVEQAFTTRSVRTDVLLLSPRLSEQAVVHRQIVEGVVAVVKLTRQNQNTAKVGLQIFDRRNGVGNVGFEEYDSLDPNIAVELVLRAKNTHAAPTSQQSYGGYGGQQQQSYSGYNAPQPSYGSSQPSYPPPQSNYAPSYSQQQAPPPPGSVPPNLQHLITNLDPNNLQNLLSAMNTPQSASAGAYSGAPASAVQVLQNNPALAGYLQQQQQQQGSLQGVGGTQSGGSGGQVNMQEILARLGSGGGGYSR